MAFAAMELPGQFGQGTFGQFGLRPAAVQAVRQWKFRPVFRNGRPVPALTQAVVDFFPNTGKPASPEDLDISEQVKSAQRFQELAAKFPDSPAETLADSEEQIRARMNLIASPRCRISPSRPWPPVTSTKRRPMPPNS